MKWNCQRHSKGTELDHLPRQYSATSTAPPLRSKLGFYPTSNRFWVPEQNEIVIDSILQSSVHGDGDSFKKEQNWITSPHDNIPPPTTTTTMIVGKDSIQLPTAFEYVHKNDIITDSILESSVHEDGNSFSMTVYCHTKREARPIRYTYLSL